MVEVTQEDREAAAKVAKMQSRYAKAANMKVGNCDTSPLVQLMASHRTTALAAKEAELAAERAENVRLRIALANIANRINVEGSPWHEAQVALDKLVVEIKREARDTLAETQP